MAPTWTKTLALLLTLCFACAGCDDEAPTYSLSEGAPEAPEQTPDDNDGEPDRPAQLRPTAGPDIPASAPLLVREGADGAPHVFFQGADSGLEVAWYDADGWQHQQLGIRPRFAENTVPFAAFEAEGRLAACAAEGTELVGFIFSSTWQTTTPIEISAEACPDCTQQIVTSCGAVLARDGLHLAWVVEHVQDGELQTRSLHYRGPDEVIEDIVSSEQLGFEVDLFTYDTPTPLLLWNLSGLVAQPVGGERYRPSEFAAGLSHTFQDGMHIHTRRQRGELQTFGALLERRRERLGEANREIVFPGRLHSVALTRRGPTAVWADGERLMARVLGPGQYTFTEVQVDVPARERENLVVTGNKASFGMHLAYVLDGKLRWEASPAPPSP